MTYATLCEHLNRAEEWIGDQPMFVGVPLMLTAILLAFLPLLALIAVAIAFVSGSGPSCVEDSHRVTIESHEMVMRGKIAVPGIVQRQVCVPEEELRR